MWVTVLMVSLVVMISGLLSAIVVSLVFGCVSFCGRLGIPLSSLLRPDRVWLLCVGGLTLGATAAIVCHPGETRWFPSPDGSHVVRVQVRHTLDLEHATMSMRLVREGDRHVMAQTRERVRALFVDGGEADGTVYWRSIRPEWHANDRVTVVLCDAGRGIRLPECDLVDLLE